MAIAMGRREGEFLRGFALGGAHFATMFGYGEYDVGTIL
jgi:hypothetical protein